jgi:hypothetical protein
MVKIPHTFLEWLVITLVTVVKFVVNLFIAIGKAIAEIWEQIVEVVGEVLLAVLEFLGDLLWLIIRAAVLVFAWMMFGITLLFLTLAIGAIALAFLPINAIFRGYMEYTVNRVRIYLGGVSFELGYDTSMAYYEFFDLELPNIRAWFTLGTTRIIDITITFMPPGFTLNTIDDSGTIQETGVNTMSNDINPELDDFISGWLYSTIGKEAESLIVSEANPEAWDLQKWWEGFPHLFLGMSDSAKLWKLSIIMGTASIGLPSDIFILAIVKYGLLVAAFAYYLGMFFAPLLTDVPLYSKKMDPYELSWYYLGAGIMSVLTGIQCLRKGKADPGRITGKKWFDTMVDLLGLNGGSKWDFIKSELGKFLKGLLKELPKTLLGIISSILGEEGLERPTFLEIDVYLFYLINDLVEWDDSFDTLYIIAGTPAVILPNYDRDLKIFSYIVIGIGIFQLIMAGFYLIEALNE